MKKRKNILFSTTRQFNLGDEAILLGILNIFDNIIGRDNYNPVIYNRNPDIRKGEKIRNKWKTKSFTKKDIRGKGWYKCIFDMDFYDNSIKDDSDFDNIDLIVFAGTPEWYGDKVKILYSKIVELDIPCMLIGIGTGESDVWGQLSKNEKQVLKNAELITVRDEATYKLLKKYNAIKITCPSILSSPIKQKNVNRVNKIGLIYSSSNISANNRISRQAYAYLKALYGEVSKKYDAEFICHYVDEIDEIEKDFPSVRYSYSYDVKDYYDLYSQYDLVIGCRVHGIGIAASLGIPGIIIKHDLRGDTARGFGSVVLTTDLKHIKEDMETIENVVCNCEKYSNNINTIKLKTMNKYIELLTPVLDKLFH